MTFDDSALLHGQPYDPIKAREYYLRTRQLKGREGPSGKPTSSSRSPVAPTVAPKTSTSRQPEIQAQKAALEARIEKLRDVLAKLVEQAKARSGTETETKTEPAAKTADSKDSGKKLTPKEKREAAERFEKYKKTEDKSTPETKTPPAKDVEVLEAQIKDIRAQISAAIAKARSLSAKPTKTATNGR